MAGRHGEWAGQGDRRDVRARRGNQLCAMAYRLGLAALALGAQAVWSAPAAAQELTRGGEIWLPQPSSGHKLVLSHASVELSLTESGAAWQGQIVLELKNPTAKPQALVLSLPERPCDSDNEVCNGRDAGRLEGLAASVDGTVQTPTVVAERESTPWWPLFGRVHRWTISVAPKAAALVEIRWSTTQTLDAEGVVVALRGLDGWRKQLKVLDVGLTLPFRPWAFGHPAPMTLARYETRIGTTGALQGKPETRLELRAKGWKSKDDITIHLGTADQIGGALRCPDPRSIAASAKAADGVSQLQRLLVMRNDSELQVCRALFLARQGFQFQDKELQQRFYGKPIKSASVSQSILEGKVRPFLRYGMQPNPRYTPELHNADDAATIDALAAELRRRKGI